MDTRPAATLPARPRNEYDQRSLGSYLRDAAELSPDVTAVVEAGSRLTYQQLYGQALSFAEALRRCGIGIGDVVLMQLPNWWEAPVCIFGAMFAGCVSNPVVPIYRAAELSFIINEARPRCLVIPHRFRNYDYVEMITPLVRDDIGEPHPIVVVVRPVGPLPQGFVSFEEFCEESSVPIDYARPDDTCLLLYTSGTTADPKGVLHNHLTLGYENRSIITLCGLTRTDSIFMGSPVTHITGFLYGVVMPAMLRSTVSLLDVWDGRRAMEIIEAERSSFTVSATPFLRDLTERYAEAGTRSALRVFLCGGADVPPELIRRSRDALGSYVARVYGSTEFPTFSCGGLDDPIEVTADTDGRPIGSAEFRIVTTSDRVGELEVRGPELFLGYLNTQLNTDSFTEDGYFRTGDLASVDERGAISIRGRKKDIIVRGGENISALEIENLLSQHPGIREVAVVAMPDVHMVEKACAYVVPMGSDQELTLPELRLFLEGHLIARQKFPERLEIVAELPRTASGKVQKHMLRERIRQKLAAETGSGAVGKEEHVSWHE
jgi:cyclohexanecarboxylate-CoA ligase